MAVYEVVNLVKTYPGRPRPANDNVSFTVAEGEVFGILGDNGAGKSTLVRQMVNLLRATSGRILFRGEPVEQNPRSVAQEVGYMPQGGEALNHLTPGEALYFTAHLRGMSRAAARRERDLLIDLWRLGDFRDVDSARLSGGQRRLVRLAVATAGAPPVLVLDEPTSDLDPLRRRQVWEVDNALRGERSPTVIVITHDALEAEAFLERVAIMHDGALVAVGRPGELKRRLGRSLHMEVQVVAGIGRLPPSLRDRAVHNRAGRWRLVLEWAEAAGYLAQLDPRHVEEISIHTPTLEDLYVHYVTGADA